MNAAECKDEVRNM